MPVFTVPVFLGVIAESKEDAVEKALNFMEYSLDVGNEPEREFPYCDVGRPDEVVEQVGGEDAAETT